MEIIFILPPLVLSVILISLLALGALNGLMFWKR